MRRRAPQRSERSTPFGSSWNLQAAHELELNLRFANRRVELGLSQVCGRRGPMGVEQFENPLLSRVVTHLCDSFDLFDARSDRFAVLSGNLAPLDDGGAPRRNLRTQIGRAHV